MTKDQIRQIAEEYADMYMERNIPLVSKKDNIRNTFIQDAYTVLSILTERYCVVARSKVVEEYNKIRSAIYFDDMGTTKFVDGRIFELEHLFGTETFNKKEDD